MGAPLTIPTDRKLREALEQRAASQGKTVPEVAREILAEPAPGSGGGVGEGEVGAEKAAYSLAGRR